MTDILTQELDYKLLDKLLDRTKAKVFIGSRAAFLGPLMCSLEFRWHEPIVTAGTNGEVVWINPRYFLLLPEATRFCLLMHELGHVWKLHRLRQGDRDPQVWNWACDTDLDNEMVKEGYSFENIFPPEMFGPDAKTWANHKYLGWAVEDIYDDMMKKSEAERKQLMKGFKPDLVEIGDKPANMHTMLNTVVAAAHAAKLTGGAGAIPGEVETTLKKFLQPKLNWKVLLYNFFTQLASKTWSWRRPRRRYMSQGMYLPSQVEQRDGLSYIIEYFDVSGSVTDDQELVFGSEFKHVLETFKPEKITVVQFDTRIQSEKDYKAGDTFDKMDIKGRGGTSLVCVRNHIIEHKPSAVVIFSDLFCEPMEKLPAGLNIPIIWVAIGNKHAQVNEGKLIHIKE